MSTIPLSYQLPVKSTSWASWLDRPKLSRSGIDSDPKQETTAGELAGSRSQLTMKIAFSISVVLLVSSFFFLQLSIHVYVFWLWFGVQCPCCLTSLL